MNGTVKLLLISIECDNSLIFIENKLNGNFIYLNLMDKTMGYAHHF